ncbi:MAG: type II secretion system F family protein [Nitrososphaerota archaeon]
MGLVLGDPWSVVSVAAGAGAGALLALLLRAGLTESMLPTATTLAFRAQLKRDDHSIASELASGASGAIGSAAAAAIGSALSIALGSSPLPSLAAGGLGLILPVMSLITLMDKPRERRSRIDSELPFFCTYLTIASSTGMTVYSAYRGARVAPGVFPQMYSEAEEVERIIYFSGKGTMEGIEIHAKSNPHDLYQATVLQAVSIQRTGGDVVTALEDRTREAFRRMEDAFERYSRSVAAIGEVAVILLFLLPVSIALTAILNPEMAPAMAIMASAFLVPVMGVGLYSAIRAASPRKPDRFEVSPQDLLLPLALGTMTPAVMMVVGLPASVSVASGILGFSLPLYLRMRPQILEVEQTEAELRRFLREISELRRLGQSIVVAVQRIAHEGRYRPHFLSLLRRVSTRVALGMKLWQAGYEARSWLARMVFFLLYVIEVTGGGHPALIEKVIDSIRVYENSKRSARSASTIFIYLAIGGPLIGALTVAMVVPLLDMLVGIGSMIAQAGQASGFGFTPPTREQIRVVSDLVMVLIILTSAALTVTVSRAADMHPYGLHRLAICAAVGIASYYMLPALSDAFGRMFLSGFGGGAG